MEINRSILHHVIVLYTGDKILRI